MVTEYATYGSLQDMIKKGKKIEKKMRVKILIDAARGIEYLHNNGILHRDIKPDNILVTTIDPKENVHGKLTDFGSSRNINLMMTNMTFTKAIGTPKYMSPEVLNKEKYTKSADVYSYAITMYECLNWGECYPKSEFSKPWDIANYVSQGKRRPRGEEMSSEEYKLISESWKQESKERKKIEEIVKRLEEIERITKEE